jgi:hypothetical protein
MRMGPDLDREKSGTCCRVCDSVVTPFVGVWRANWETACTSVVFRKLGDAQCTMLARFPKLDVAGSHGLDVTDPPGPISCW